MVITHRRFGSNYDIERGQYRRLEARPLEIRNPYIRAISRTARLLKPGIKLAAKTLGYAATDKIMQTPVSAKKRKSAKSLSRDARSRSRGRSAMRGSSASRAMSISGSRGRSRSRSRVSFVSTTAGGGGGGASGYNGGSFRKPKTIKSKLSSRVVVVERETSGRVTDARCAYLGHSTLIPVQLHTNFLAACCRYLFQYHNGKQILMLDEPLGSLAGYTQQIRFRLFSKRLDTSALAEEANVQLDATNFISILDVANALTTAFGNIYVNKLTAAELNKIGHSITVEYRVNTVATQWTTQGTLYLEQMNIDVYGYSRLKMQNQTTYSTATGPGDGSAEADSSNHQPITGFQYHFNNMMPVLKTAGPGVNPLGFPINGVNGVIIRRASETGQNETIDPPNPAMFNASKSSKIGLEAGSIKSSILTYKKVMDVNKFFTLVNGWSSTNQGRTNVGTCRLFGLEKLINWGSNYISLVYEHENRTSVSFNFKKPQVCAKYTYIASLSNEQPL